MGFLMGGKLGYAALYSRLGKLGYAALHPTYILHTYWEVGLRCASPNLLKGLRAKSRGGTGYPKTVEAEEVARDDPAAAGTTAVYRIVAPRTAAQHSIVCHSIVCVAQKVD